MPNPRWLYPDEVSALLYSGLIIDNMYQVVEEIGSGGMGVVYLAFHIRLEKYVVLKRIKNTVSDIHKLRNEVDILKSLRHTYLPQVYDFIRYEGDIFTVIDYIEGCDLKYYLENGYTFSENQLIKWLRQLAEVLEYLHTHYPPIIHSDIKPANIILTPDSDICLIDFGISLSGAEDIKGISVEYSSPEQYYNADCINKGYRDWCVPIDGRTDIYSVGVTFYHLMTGIKPNLFTAVPPISTLGLPYSDGLVSIVEKAMAYDINERFRDSAQFKKAVNNIHKLESGYKKSVAAQIICSVLAGIMIVSGAVMMISGTRMDRAESFRSAYADFADSVKSGSYQSACREGRELINDPGYSSVMSDRVKAEILHSVGDCYYYEEDYVNAADSYRLAYELAKKLDDPEIYYRDYAVALAQNGNSGKALAVLDEMSARFGASASVYLVKGRIALGSGDWASAISMADSALGCSSDKLNRSAAYELKGDGYREAKDHVSAAGCYVSAYECSPTSAMLRKRGNTILMIPDLKNRHELCEQALSCFRQLYDSYVYTRNDVFNLCQCCLILGDKTNISSGIKTAEEYTASYGESYEIAVISALLHEAAEDGKAGVYSQKAHDLYMSMSESEKRSVDEYSLSEIRRIYSKYQKGVW